MVTTRRTEVKVARGILPHNLVVVPQSRRQSAVPPPELAVGAGDVLPTATVHLDGERPAHCLQWLVGSGCEVETGAGSDTEALHMADCRLRAGPI